MIKKPFAKTLAGFAVLGGLVSVPIVPQDMTLLYSYQYRPSSYITSGNAASTSPKYELPPFVDEDENDLISVSVFRKADGTKTEVKISDADYFKMGLVEGQRFNTRRQELLSVASAIIANAAITYDTSTTADVTATSLTYAFTPSANANTTLVINAVQHVSSGSSDPTSVTFNGNNATKQCNVLNTTWGSDTPQSLWVYYVGTPDGAAHNVVVTGDGATLRIESGVESVYGTTSSPAGATGTNEGNSSSQSVSVTTTSDNSWVVDGYNFNGTIAGRNPDASSPTIRRYRADSGEGSSFGGGDTPTTAAGSYSSTWTTSASLFWTGCAVEIKAGADAGASDTLFSPARIF